MTKVTVMTNVYRTYFYIIHKNDVFHTFKRHDIKEKNALLFEISSYLHLKNKS